MKLSQQVRLALLRLCHGRSWAERTLVVGPIEPVDGDSVSCVKAVLNLLRRWGFEAYTLPTISSYRQLSWILNRQDIHSSCSPTAELTAPDPQAQYDAMLKSWVPDEIVLVDGPRDRLGFDPRGVKVYTIDHHSVSTGKRDDVQGYIQPAASAGCLLIERFHIKDPLLAVSILTDTFWFRRSFPADALRSMSTLTDHGLSNEVLIDVQRQLKAVKDSSILKAMLTANVRFLGRNQDAAFVLLQEANPEIHRGVIAELEYFCRYLCVVRADGYVSFWTSDTNTNMEKLARKYGGGGHVDSAAAHNVQDKIEALFTDFQAVVEESFASSIATSGTKEPL